MTGHVYQSTACWHKLHDLCRASCDWCHAPCSCKCHNDETRR